MTCCFLSDKGTVIDYSMDSLLYMRDTYEADVKASKKDKLLCLTHFEAVKLRIADLTKEGPKKYKLDSSVKAQPKAIPDIQQRAANDGSLIE